MIRFRLRHPNLRRRRFLTGNAPEGRSRPDIQWHGTVLGQPHWEDTQGRRLAFTLAGLEPGQPALHVMLNMAADAAPFELPRILGQHWRRAVDTDQAPWVFDVEREAGYRSPRRRVAGRSIVVLESRPMAGARGAAADDPPGPDRQV